MSFDFGAFVEQIGDKVANIKGYDNVSDLITNKAAQNVARITSQANTTKQTPPVVQPTAYTQEFLAEQGIAGLTKGQLILLGGIALVAIVLIARR